MRAYAKAINDGTGGNDDKDYVPPISMMAIVGFTHAQTPLSPPTSPYAQNDNTVLSPVSAFWGGAITDHIGAFAQVTYNALMVGTFGMRAAINPSIDPTLATGTTGTLLQPISTRMSALMLSTSIMAVTTGSPCAEATSMKTRSSMRRSPMAALPIRQISSTRFICRAHSPGAPITASY
jgi:hypothetical protein